MRKLGLALAATAVVLGGCAGMETRPLSTQVVEINTPILYTPRPPILDRPDLIIHELSPAERNNPGTVAQFYKATLLQLLGYVEELESVIDGYTTISNTLEDNERMQEAGRSIEVR